MMRLDASTRYMIGKSLKPAVEPAEVFLQALTSAVFFGIMFYCVCFEVRYQDAGVSVLIALFLILISSAVTVAAVGLYRLRRPSRRVFVAAIVMIGGLAAGYIFGDRFWYSHTVRYFTYGEMANYVNIDPNTDKGQSYMDAGTVYFKEDTRVDASTAVSFHNGLTYCVAPIVRTRVRQGQNATLQTVNGFTPPASGTVDFWAVGTDCCGDNGGTFTCGDVGLGYARSGGRLLDETARSMYLLAVQEWSATTGLPVRHPLFFHWLADPIAHAENLHNGAWAALFFHAAICFGIALVVAAGLHTFLKRLSIQ